MTAIPVGIRLWQRAALELCGIGLMRAALLTCALIAAIETLARYGILKISDPPALALIAVIDAGYSAGLRAGLLSAALAVLYGLHFFSPPGAPLQFQGDDAARIAVLALVAPFLAWITGVRSAAGRGACRSPPLPRTEWCGGPAGNSPRAAPWCRPIRTAPKR